MSEMKLDWDDLKLFLAVARKGGLSGAVALTGKSAPTLGRRILALEEITGTELFHRAARGYRLTEQGIALMEKVIELESQILPLDKSAEKGGAIRVKISAGSWMTRFLCTKIDVILKENQNTRLSFISAEHVLDISRRETVIGIRNQPPHQPGLTRQKLGQVHFAGYARSSKAKPWVRVLGNMPSALWLAQQSDTSLDLEVNAPRNALDLALTGKVRALLPTFVGDNQADLVRVTPLIKELTHDQWLVTHQDERFRPEVRMTIDRIYELTRVLHQQGKIR